MMKFNSQFSIATLMVAGLFATGCSQQSVDGGSQVAGGSQSQIEGGSQVAGSQQAGSQQQVDDTKPVVVTPPMKHKHMAHKTGANCHSHPANSRTNTIRHCHPNPTGVHRYGGGTKPHHGGRWVHTHPAVPGCTKSIRHAHKYKHARHSHQYGCKGKKRHHGNQWGHTHAAIPKCTNSYRHTHKYNARNHSHHYSCRGMKRHAQPAQVDVYALQRKLKAKGYYKGPIDGVVGPGTRGALKRFMNR